MRDCYGSTSICCSGCRWFRSSRTSWERTTISSSRSRCMAWISRVAQWLSYCCGQNWFDHIVMILNSPGIIRRCCGKCFLFNCVSSVCGSGIRPGRSGISDFHFHSCHAFSSGKEAREIVRGSLPRRLAIATTEIPQGLGLCVMTRANGAVWELFWQCSRNNQWERTMKACLSRLSPLALVGLSIPALIIVHTVLSVVVPTIIRVVVPETVRVVLHLV